MPQASSAKQQALKAAGTFNPRADQVSHLLFQESDFFDPHDLLQLKYETLRGHVLDNRQGLGADPLGLVLLLRQGVAGWMRSWSGAVSSASASPPPLAASSLPCSPIPEWQQQLTELLAQMTSAHLPAATT